MGDIDKDISLAKMVSICKRVQKKFLLSDMYIIKSNHGFNFYSLDKLALKSVKEINFYIEEVDPVFNYLAYYKRGFYVLRTLPKDDKKLVRTVAPYVNPTAPPTYVKSNAHRIFFNNVWNIDVKKDGFFDDLERVFLIQFKNQKYGWEVNDD